MQKIIDIIFLSYAKTEHLKNLTIQSIDTLLNSEDPEKILFNIVVVESNKSMAPYQFENTNTIYPEEEFGFHKFLNIGIRATSNQYVCLCNNDLIFHKSWASEILKAIDNDPTASSITPYCPIFHKKNGFSADGAPIEGYFGLLTGWCIFVKRDIFNTIGYLDENFKFWYCDYDYTKTLEKFKVKNILVPASKVTHIGSESLNTLNKREYNKLTQLPRFYFNYKWHHRSIIRYKASLLKYRITEFLAFLQEKYFFTLKQSSKN
ncbi:MAG: glycosyltransferase [Pedobacter sp.]|nr:MAG: glycosyltransferase [Pedobacter sp.]